MSGRGRPLSSIKSNKETLQKQQIISPQNLKEKEESSKPKHVSLIRKRSSDDGWGGKGMEGYMHSKLLKLDNQFLDDQYHGADHERSEIFKDVVIFVNGYTQPSSDELRKLIIRHGGGYQQYYSLSLCTHIIATNLPDSKIKDIKNKKVVHPDWILDSIKAGMKLPIYRYLLYGGAKNVLPKIQFEGKSIASLHKDSSSKESQIQEDSSPLQLSKDLNCDNTRGDTELTCFQVKEASVESHTTVLDKLDDKISFDDQEYELLEETDRLFGVEDNQNESITKGAPEEPEHEPKGPVLSKHEYSHGVSRSHGKAGDANFMSDFYSNSRLHHLSMWRSELKRFATMINQKGRRSKGKQSVAKEQRQKVIVHIDLDSFFVSVALKEQPHLQGLPIAVCHAGRAPTDGNAAMNVTSMSEIASCSYEARSQGVRNGMFLGQARKLCPEIHCVPYYFEKYRDVSQAFYEILATYTCEIEAVSCDEALLDITDLITNRMSPLGLVSKVRASVFDNTGCTASAGIGPNILIARMATRKAKPNGQYYVTKEQIPDFIVSQKVDDLPGVGWSLGRKLSSLNIVDCGDLQKFQLQYLQKEFGHKTGLSLYHFCRGEDNRTLRTEQERKSVSAEINYGIRFEKDSEPEQFVRDLAEEVQRRLDSIGLVGCAITLKLMVRKQDAPNPAKFMGHGICGNLSRSCNISVPTSDAVVIAKECITLLKQLNIPPSDFRGMGVQVSKLSDASRMSKIKGEATLHQFIKEKKESCVKAMLKEDHHEDRACHEVADESLVTSKQESENNKNIEEVVDLESTNIFDGEVTSNEHVKDVTIDQQVRQSKMAITSLLHSTEHQRRNRFTDVIAGKTGERSPSMVNSNKRSPSKRSPSKRSPSKRSPSKRSPLKGSPSKGRGRSQAAVTSNSKLTQFITRPKLHSSKSGPSGSELEPRLPFLPSPSSFTQDRVTFPDRAPVDIDYGVLNELPDDVRAAIVKEYNLSLDTDQYSHGCKEMGKATATINKAINTPQKSGDQHNCSEVFARKASSGSLLETPKKKDQELSSASYIDQNLGQCDGFLSPSQIDPSVLPALPDNIREEIESVMRTRKSRRLSASIKEGNALPSQKAKVNHSATNISQSCGNNPTSSIEVKDAGRVAEQNEMKPLIADEDVSKLLSPSQVDVSVLQYLPNEIQSEIRIAMAKKSSRPIEASNEQVLDAKPVVTDSASAKVGIVETPKKVYSLDTSFLSPSQIDPDVMDVLPWEVQQEIHLGLRRRAIRKEREKKRQEYTKIEQVILDKKIEEQLTTVGMNQEVQMKIPTLLGMVDYEDVKRLMKEWIQSTEDPLDEDISCVTGYLEDLLHQPNLESPYLLLKCMKRSLTKCGEVWKCSFNTILQNIQCSVELKYGSRFPVTRFMMCSDEQACSTQEGIATL